jgi:hypothetical protein
MMPSSPYIYSGLPYPLTAATKRQNLHNLLK